MARNWKRLAEYCGSQRSFWPACVTAPILLSRPPHLAAAGKVAARFTLNAPRKPYTINRTDALRAVSTPAMSRGQADICPAVWPARAQRVAPRTESRRPCRRAGYGRRLRPRPCVSGRTNRTRRLRRPRNRRRRYRRGRAGSARRGSLAAPLRSSSGPGRTDPAICASAARPRCKPSSLFSDTARRSGTGSR